MSKFLHELQYHHRHRCSPGLPSAVLVWWGGRHRWQFFRNFPMPSPVVHPDDAGSPMHGKASRGKKGSHLVMYRNAAVGFRALISDGRLHCHAFRCAFLNLNAIANRPPATGYRIGVAGQRSRRFGILHHHQRQKQRNCSVVTSPPSATHTKLTMENGCANFSFHNPRRCLGSVPFSVPTALQQQISQDAVLTRVALILVATLRSGVSSAINNMAAIFVDSCTGGTRLLVVVGQPRLPNPVMGDDESKINHPPGSELVRIITLSRGGLKNVKPKHIHLYTYRGAFRGVEVEVESSNVVAEVINRCMFAGILDTFSISLRLKLCLVPFSIVSKCVKVNFCSK
ncbi:3-dehydroquinate synthase [Anopheles sinensis]|uniref:3-dehydroquinate synthase n=1 Tax=Anopheles sinensis TaxID=74873 RepID=A0A084VBA9_ANOSI|nr:3-dehydroquinate synthase [Anopheles sinensis]